MPTTPSKPQSRKANLASTAISKPQKHPQSPSSLQPRGSRLPTLRPRSCSITSAASWPSARARNSTKKSSPAATCNTNSKMCDSTSRTRPTPCARNAGAADWCQARRARWSEWSHSSLMATALKMRAASKTRNRTTCRWRMRIVTSYRHNSRSESAKAASWQHPPKSQSGTQSWKAPPRRSVLSETWSREGVFSEANAMIWINYFCTNLPI